MDSLRKTRRLQQQKPQEKIGTKIYIIATIVVVSSLLLLLLVIPSKKTHSKSKKAKIVKPKLYKEQKRLEKQKLASHTKIKPKIKHTRTIRRAHKQSGKGFGKLTTPYEREIEWIVYEICWNIAKMVYYAKHKSVPETTDLDLKVTYNKNSPNHKAIFDVKVTIKNHAFLHNIHINDNMWKHHLYEKFTLFLLQKLKVTVLNTSKENRADERLLKALLDLQTNNLININKKITQKLTENILDHNYHEKAALLLGAMGLRETSKFFFDVRKILCRMTAHLALSIAISRNHRSAQNISGHMAYIILCTLSGNQAFALKTMSGLPNTKTVNAWKNALIMRNTKNWKILDSPESKTLLERLEYARALHYSFGATSLARFLRKHIASFEPVPDWGRIMISKDFSVGEGHMFASKALKFDLYELRQVWEGITKTPLNPEEIITILNTPQGHSIQNNKGQAKVCVLNLGIWSAFLQRQLCMSMWTTYDFFKNMWGVKEHAEKFKSETMSSFSNLKLYPIVARIVSEGQQEYLDAMHQANTLCQNYPELITASCWNRLMMWAKYKKPPGLPNKEIWFRGIIPIGALYNFYDRVSSLDRVKITKLHSWKYWSEMAPYNFEILCGYLNRKYGQKWSKEVIYKYLATFVKFNLNAMFAYANVSRDQPQKCIALYEQICQKAPEHYLTLARYLVEQNLNEKAVEAYEEALALGSNRVQLSNSCEWLVNYYFDNGQKEDALRIATFAARVYSYGGLRTMAKLQERMGNFEQAEDYYKKIATRYDMEKELDAFYARRGK